MLHLKNSDYTPKDAKTVRSDARDLTYGMSVVIRDCRISSKFIELDVSVHKNNLELLLELNLCHHSLNYLYPFLAPYIY